VPCSNPLLGLDVDARTVATVIADWTGVPLSLMKDEQTELLSLEESSANAWWAGRGAERHRAAPARRKTGLTPENGPQGSCWSGRAAPAKPKPRWRWPMRCSAARNR
jgi:type VI secretion system protein VasG